MFLFRRRRRRKFWLLIQVIAVALEMLIPVGKFDDDLDIGIHSAGRAKHQIAGDFVHGLYAEPLPSGM
jgi:hypothetical protein